MAFPDGWTKKKKITIKTDHLDADHADFPLCVPIKADADIGAACLANGHDIRFTAGDGKTLLPYERVSFSVSSGKATGEFWVKCSPKKLGSCIFVHYGNAAADDGEDPTSVWDSNYKAVYHMNDYPDTSHIKDSTSNANHGAKKGAGHPTEVSGKIGRGQQHAPDEYIEAPENGTLDIADNLTISAWLRFDAEYDGNAFQPLSKWLWSTATANYVLYFFGQPSGINKTIRWYANRGSAWDAISAGYEVALETWYHVGIAYTSSGGGQLYINGAMVGAATGSGALATNDAQFRTWARASTCFDDIRISSVARSAAWIKFEYHNMADADNCLAWGVEMDEAGGQVRGPCVCGLGLGLS